MVFLSSKKVNLIDYKLKVIRKRTFSQNKRGLKKKGTSRLGLAPLVPTPLSLMALNSADDDMDRF